MTLPPDPTPMPKYLPGNPNELTLGLAQAQAVLEVIKDLVAKLEQQLCELQCCDIDDDGVE